MEPDKPLATLFTALRERLSTRIAAPDATDGAPMVPTLGARDLRVQQTERLAAIYNAREQVRARRRRVMERASRARASVDAVCGDRRHVLQTESYTRDEHVQKTHASALRRLQALFVECVAEMDKATKRARKAAAAKSVETNSAFDDQAEVLRRNAQWRRFLSRLEVDSRGAIQSQLIDPSDEELLRVKEEVTSFIQTNRPSVAIDHIAVVDTIIAVYGDAAANGGGTSQDDRTLKRRSTIHFFDTSRDAWNDLIGSTQKAHKRRQTVSSARKSKCDSSASTRSRSADRVVRFAQTEDGRCSMLRRIAAPLSARLSAFSMDMSLSCASVRWLLPLSIVTQLRDTCVYFALSDYRFTGDEASDIDMEASTDLAKIRARQLHSIKSRNGTSEKALSHAIEDSSGSVYVRATLAELLQTNYFISRFLPLIGDEGSGLDKRYPLSLRNNQTIHALYVAVEDHQKAGCQLVALEEPCLHELCVIYVARGLRERSNPRLISSLAQSDALKVIPSDRPAPSPMQFCVIRNPQPLIDSLNTLQRSQTLRSYEWLFVEFHIALPRAITTPVRHQSLTQSMLRLINSECSWRSCLDSATSQSSRHPHVCQWHQLLRSSVSVPAHYISTLCPLKECPQRNQALYANDAVRKTLIKASSLLEELSSHQLGQSVATFVSHVKQSMYRGSYNERDLPEEVQGV